MADSRKLRAAFHLSFRNSHKIRWEFPSLPALLLLFLYTFVHAFLSFASNWTGSLQCRADPALIAASVTRTTWAMPAGVKS